MQSSQPDPRTSGDALLASLFQVGRMMRHAGTASVDPHTYWLLHNLRCQGTVRMTDIAETLDLDASTVSRHLQNLDRSGLVHRSRHPEDGRAQVVAISAAGEAVLDQAHQDRLQFVAERTADWDPVELATLTRLLAQFAGSGPTGEPSPQSSPARSSAETVTASAATSAERVSELEHA